MSKIYMVRHGRAVGSWTEDVDPGLDDLGWSQAEAAADSLLDMGELLIISSPLKRAQETAVPYAQKVQGEIQIEHRIAEIPSPGLDMQDRGAWLGQIMSGRWSNQSRELQDWRSTLIEYLIGLDSDTAVFSHFVAINVAVGGAVGDDRVVGFRPDNGSITRLESDGKNLKLIGRGNEASTQVG